MLVTSLAVALVPAVGSAFGYLRYRAYLKFARHLVDNHGLPGLLVLGVVGEPGKGALDTAITAMDRKKS